MTTQVSLTEEVVSEWQPIIEAEGAPALKTSLQKRQMALMLETSKRVLTEETNTTGMALWDPVLVSIIRRTQPSLIGNQLVGVQPMTMPTGLVFIMRNYYVAADGTRTETWNQVKPDKSKSGPMDTDDAEALGHNRQVTVDLDGTGAKATKVAVTETSPWQEMDFRIEKTAVTAKSRALKARYTTELATDLRNVHGADAEQELATMLSGEIVAEIDRELLQLMLDKAVPSISTTASSNTFDLDSDTDGRWEVEKYKALAVKIEKEGNKIALGTRRGKGNFIVTSANVAGALNMAGKVDTMTQFGSLEPNTVGMSYVGMFAGTYRLYVDPYAVLDYVLVGYKGPNIYDAGIFYCPYVPLEFMRATGPDDFQPRIGFKTRYGLIENPFAQYDGSSIAYTDGTKLGSGNQYYRKFTITNL